MKKNIILFLLFLIYISTLGSQHYYTPFYHYGGDPLFQILIQHPSKGVILSGLVQSYKGLNVQIVSEKQYFVPQKLILNIHQEPVNLYCYSSDSMKYLDFVESIKECFSKRKKEQWQMISQALDSNLVMTLKDIQIPELRKIAENQDFNLYEIEK